MVSDLFIGRCTYLLSFSYLYANFPFKKVFVVWAPKKTIRLPELLVNAKLAGGMF